MSLTHFIFMAERGNTDEKCIASKNLKLHCKFFEMYKKCVYTHFFLPFYESDKNFEVSVKTHIPRDTTLGQNKIFSLFLLKTTGKGRNQDFINRHGKK